MDKRNHSTNLSLPNLANYFGISFTVAPSKRIPNKLVNVLLMGFANVFFVLFCFGVLLLMPFANGPQVH